MLLIHISTPLYSVINATDIGEIKAACAIAKTIGAKTFTHINQDNPNRFASVVRNNKNVQIIKTI